MSFTTLRSIFLVALITVLLSSVLVSCSASPSPQSAILTPISPKESVPTSTKSLATATAQPKSSGQSTSTPRISTFPSATSTRTAVSTQKALTSTVTATVQPSPTAPLIEPAASQFTAGTPFPNSIVPIRADNLTQLARIAQWGKGSIQRIGFSPDGQSLLAGSPFGIAVYAMNDFDQPLRWLPFEAPVFFRYMQISKDGTLVRLEWPQDYPSTGTESRIFNLTEQKFQAEDSTVEWIFSQDDGLKSYNGISIMSPDNNLRFEGSVGLLNENTNREVFTGVIYNEHQPVSRILLKDESFYVQYEDFNRPEGCDLKSFSMCGNVYDPNIMAPYRAYFSPDGKLLALLYRPPNLYNNQRFSVLRTYSTQDGSLINTFGSFDQPIQDFAFQPGSDLLSIAFVNGSIQIWDPARQKMLHQAWNFSPPVTNVAFSGDGRYLLIQYSDAVEVLRTSDGAVTGRYAASTFALAPKENLLAIGGKKGSIQVEDLDQNKTISRMVGHTKIIYALAFSPDGQTLTSSSEDCSIRSWDAHNGKFLHYFEKAEVDAIGEGWTKSRIFVYYMRYLPGSNQLMGFGSWGTAASWNTQSGAKEFAVVSQPLEYYNGMKTLNPHFPQSFWLAPEESRFYINDVGYDLKSGEFSGGYTPPANLPEGCGPEGPRSADGTIRFTPGYGDLDGQICVLNASDDHLLYRIPVYPDQGSEVNPIQVLFLSSDGTRLYAASLAGPILVYQVQP